MADPRAGSDHPGASGPLRTHAVRALAALRRPGQLVTVPRRPAALWLCCLVDLGLALFALSQLLVLLDRPDLALRLDNPGPWLVFTVCGALALLAAAVAALAGMRNGHRWLFVVALAYFGVTAARGLLALQRLAALDLPLSPVVQGVLLASVALPLLALWLNIWALRSAAVLAWFKAREQDPRRGPVVR